MFCKSRFAMEKWLEEWPYKIKGKHLENVSFYKFALSSTYKIYGQQPYILEEDLDMMIYLFFYKVNVFSYILYGHTLSH